MSQSIPTRRLDHSLRINDAEQSFGQGSGCYTCGICKEKTRETGEGESDDGYCVTCFFMLMDENTIAGLDRNSEYGREFIAGFKKKYGCDPSPWCLNC
jgi:hypothetical protein